MHAEVKILALMLHAVVFGCGDRMQQQRKNVVDSAVTLNLSAMERLQSDLHLLELPGIARHSKRLFNGMANPARVKKATLATVLRNKVAPRCVMYSEKKICMIFYVLVFLLR